MFSIVHDVFHLPSPFVNNIKSQYCGSHNSYNVKMQKHFASLQRGMLFLRNWLWFKDISDSKPTIIYITGYYEAAKNIQMYHKTTKYCICGFSTNLSAALCSASSPQVLKWVVTLGWGWWFSTTRVRWEEQRMRLSSQGHSWHCWCCPYRKTH